MVESSPAKGIQEFAIKKLVRTESIDTPALDVEGMRPCFEKGRNKSIRSYGDQPVYNFQIQRKADLFMVCLRPDGQCYLCRYSVRVGAVGHFAANDRGAGH